MDDLRRAGGISAILQAGCWATILVAYLAILPGQGFTSPSDMADPARVLPFVRASALLTIVNGIDILFAVFILLTVLALDATLRPGSPALMRVATAAGVIAAALTLLSGMVGVIAVPEVASLDARAPALAAPAYLALHALLDALLFATPFAYGGWALLANAAALRSGSFPRPLAYVGYIFSVTGILAFLIPPLGLLGPILGIGWTIWLGLILLQNASGPVQARAIPTG